MTGGRRSERRLAPSSSRDRLTGSETGGDLRRDGRLLPQRVEGSTEIGFDHEGPDLERLAKVLVAIALRIVIEGEDKEDE
jgi:hypothetical protein